MAEGDPPVVPPVVPPVAPPAPAWYAGLDENTRGYIQNNGLAEKSPAEAFAAAAHAHQEATKFIGAPASELLRIPNDQNPDAWKPIWQRLGAPADAAGYDLSTIKRGDQPLDPGFVAAVQQAAAAANLPAQGAVKMTEAYVAYETQRAATEAADRTAALETQRNALKASWGQNFEPNLAAAKQAFLRTGATPEQVNALESVIGYDKVMEFFRGISTKIAEDTYVEGKTSANNAPTTVEAAREAITAKHNDRDWVQRWSNGGVAEQQELDKLMRQAYPNEYAAAAAS